VEGRGADEFVFTNTRGGPVRRSNFIDQAWAPGRHAVGQDAPEVVKPKRGRSRTVWKPGPGKHPTPHDARHTYASLQIARGKSLAFIQRQLGHETIDTTNGTYGHLLTEDLRTLADVIDVADGLEVAPPRQIEG
jgi:integrase